MWYIELHLNTGENEMTNSWSGEKFVLFAKTKKICYSEKYFSESVSSNRWQDGVTEQRTVIYFLLLNVEKSKYSIYTLKQKKK